MRRLSRTRAHDKNIGDSKLGENRSGRITAEEVTPFLGVEVNGMMVMGEDKSITSSLFSLMNSELHIHNSAPQSIRAGTERKEDTS